MCMCNVRAGERCVCKCFLKYQNHDQNSKYGFSDLLCSRVRVVCSNDEVKLYVQAVWLITRPLLIARARICVIVQMQMNSGHAAAR